MHTDLINSFTDYLVLSGLIPLVIFVVMYFFRSPYDDNEIGIALMFQKLGFIALLGIIVLSLFLGPYPGREWVRVVFYSIIVIGFWVDLVNLRRYQRRYQFRWKDAPRKRKGIIELIRTSIRG